MFIAPIKETPKLASARTCSGCSACFSICPKSAITMEPNEEGFLYPVVNQDMCVNCHACEHVCPVLHPSPISKNPIGYAARSKDKDVRLASSSGGIFTELAKSILNSGGVIFGCKLDDTLTAIHAKIDTLEGLKSLQGSKYVQSDLKNTFKEAKTILQSGREVLFSGTSCQIAGLKHYLKKDYPNLLTLEVICHGVPSPAVFAKYKSDVEEREKTTIQRISFRNKHYSWRRCALELAFANSRANLEDLRSNIYFNAFLSNICLRPSCYRCKAKSGRSLADITLADFWGIEKVCPSLDDNTGTSAVILHSQKAKDIWKQMSPALDYEQVPLKSITAGNPTYHRSVFYIPIAKNRKLFMQSFKTQSFENAYKNSSQKPWYILFARKCYIILLKVLKK